jgi:branched-chain amino acid transport system ATP-binding protein
MTTALSTQGLCRSFGAVKGADNINVKFEAGTVVALIGTNGAGKTTFLNLVMGYLKPDSGSVLLGERNITGMEPRDITRLGVARSFQMPQLFDQLTVDENLEVAEIIARHASTASQTKELSRVRALALERFGLVPQRDQLAKTLPGGARKLLDIAMAVVSHPSVLVLDEPTSGVSAEEKESVVETVIELARGLNAMTLFVEHDMEVVAQYADRVLAFFAGRIIADGTAAEVLDSPEVRRLIVGTALGADGHA